MNTDKHRVSIAPMMDHTDRHFRYFMRLLSSQMMLYTEMITTGALIHGDRKRFLEFNEIEHPVAIQLGGNNPDDLTACAVMAESEGYDEINLNIGCPSDRVQNGMFGACLMASPDLVAECVNKISSQVSIPVTVKTRIGIDEQDSYAFLSQFIKKITDAGCQHVIIHARKAILSGLSPKENREIPPLNYQRVYDIKNEFPDLCVTINGGINKLDEITQHLIKVDGVMLGRLAYQNPYVLADIDSEIYGITTEKPSRERIMHQYCEYIKKQVSLGLHPKSLSRHMIGLFQGQPGARFFRRKLSETKPINATDTSYLDALLEL